MSELIFVGFNSRIAALDRATGETVWSWKAPHGSGFVSLLLDGDQLIACVQGYTWSLDPATGETLWENLLSGFGYGIACVISTSGSNLTQSSSAAAMEELTRQQSAG